VEIRGGTTIPTRRYGTSYAEVRYLIRGGTASKGAFQMSLVNNFIRGGTVLDRPLADSPWQADTQQQKLHSQFLRGSTVMFWV
jgi:hypothetical protein